MFRLQRKTSLHKLLILGLLQERCFAEIFPGDCRAKSARKEILGKDAVFKLYKSL